MANEAKTVAPLFQLRGVELHELTIHKPVPGVATPANFNFEVSVVANVDSNKKLVINATHVKIKGDKQDAILGSITCACIFSVGNFEEVITMKSETLAEINETFAETINSISISTTRGVMFSELKGTTLHYAFLPIIDIKSLAKATV
ncbi:MAG TPA: hypothetical protein VGQ59_17745 [Cyclobacteriaceae bacterium]|jgi:hypothetical protein|nr:hypothetical protein [Cyclobacteriaceae bacterium]